MNLRITPDLRQEPLNVLISGGGVAGSTVAFWLKQYGFSPTVVERAPTLREGGQAVDFRGQALTVLDRMGVLDQVKARDTAIGDCTIVDAAGTPYATMPSVIYAGELEVLIDELIAIVHRRAADSGVEYLFGDSITAMAPDDDGVTVTFENAAQRRFDLVIGADGAHSLVRRLAFGPEEKFAHFLNCYYGYFTIDNYLHLDHEGFATGDGEAASVSVFSAKHNAEARAGVLFKADSPLAYDRHDLEAQKQILAKHSAHLGWEISTLLEKLAKVDDLYFDAMTQIRMDSWSNGRVVLVGDAAYCAAPTSGRGTSQALIGAYVLAGELANADGDHRSAFAAYESALRDYVSDNQAIGDQGSQYVFSKPTQEMFDAMAAEAGKPDAEQENPLALDDYRAG